MSRSRPAYAVKSGRLTEAEKTAIVILADRGLTPSRIAQRLERHPGTVSFHMTMTGQRAPVVRSFVYQRHGKTVRSFLAEEDAFVTELRTAGVSTAEIARRASDRFDHPRSPATISIRLRMLAAREEAA